MRLPSLLVIGTAVAAGPLHAQPLNAGGTNVIGVSTLTGGLVWPFVSMKPATRIVFCPISNRSYGEVNFLLSGSDSPTEITTLNVSDITVGTTYSFGFSGCYQ